MFLARKLTFIICAIIVVLISLPILAKLTGSLSEDAIEQRMAPAGQVKIQGLDTSSVIKNTQARTPKDIYDKNCKLCHASGLAGAPKFANKKDWEPRITQGLDALVKTAWEGIRAMPPKGNCLDCSKEDIQNTVEYMINSVQ